MKTDEDSQLESLLLSLPLRQPGAGFDARMDAALSVASDSQARRLWIFHPLSIAAGLLLAAGIGIRLSLPRPVPVAQIAAPAAHPIRVERDSSTVYDDGIIADTGDAAYQQFRRRTVWEIWVVDPATHATVEATIPTEQIVIEKVDAY